jgi:hypothetical protein
MDRPAAHGSLCGGRALQPHAAYHGTARIQHVRTQ